MSDQTNQSPTESPATTVSPSPSTAPPLSTWHRYDLLTLLILFFTSVWHLSQLSRFELAPDEAYYWDWSRQLDWGYYDQGPLIAYVIRITTWLFGTTEFGVRFGVWAASVGTLLCAWWLARRLFSPLAGLLTVVLLVSTPLMTVGSLIATYDPLLVFCWALTLVCLERALFAPILAVQRSYWLLAGVATGLGFLSKHTMVLILPCLVLYLLLSTAHRHWLLRPEPYLAFLIALLLYSGVFYWNIHHHWWTFGHLLFLAKKSTNSPLSRLGEFGGSQALLLGPGLFLACIAVLKRKRATDPLLPSPTLFLISLGYPILAFFCLMTLRAKVQANWAPCAWITPTILVAGWLAEKREEREEGREGRGKRGKRGKREEREEREEGKELDTCDYSIPTNTQYSRIPIRNAVLLSLPGFLLTLFLVSAGLRYAVGVRLKPKDDVTVQMVGWHEMAKRVQQVRAEMGVGGRKVFLAGNGYQYCALMAFYLPDHPPTYDMYLHYRLTMYAAHVERLKEHLGEDCLFLNDGRADDHDLRTVFERVTWDEPPFPIWRPPYNREPVRFIHMARCRGYRRYTGIEWAVGG